MMTLGEAARAVGGTLRGADIGFDGVTTDSRALRPGQFFVALRGERFDAHDFVADVLAAGAAGVLVDVPWAAAHPDIGPVVVVKDTRLALGQLAAEWRRGFKIPLVGVTGSNGKTTVKEMCAAIFSAHFGADAVLATQGNLNNDIGLPLTLLGLRTAHRAAVIEMGMNHAGEIAYLTRIAAPTVAVVNNAQRAHLEGLGSVEAVACAKGEIFEGLAADGIAVLNLDDPCFPIWRDVAQGVVHLRFGFDAAADVSAAVQPGPLGSLLNLRTPQGSISVTLHVPGLHNARNALAATAVGLAAGVPLTTIAAALSSYAGVKGRLQQKQGQHGALVLDDTYNANPDSMKAAVDVLSMMPGRRVMVVGDMGEVGEAGGQFHDELGGYAKSMGVDRLYCLGELSPAAAHTFGEGGAHFTRIDDLIRAVKHELNAETTVLVKGSRFMRMERVVEAIVEKREGSGVRREA